jgi:glc operon protein GlcG
MSRWREYICLIGLALSGTIRSAASIGAKNIPERIWMMRNVVLTRMARVFLGGLMLSSVSVAAHAAPPLTATATVLTLAGAKTVLKAAEQTADSLKAPSSIAIVDTSGTLVAFESLDGVRAGSPALAIGKARTAALLQRPSSEIEDNTNNGRIAMVTAGLLALRGGIPLRAGNAVVGAVGVAGMNKDNDVKIATAAAAQFASAVASQSKQ